MPCAPTSIQLKVREVFMESDGNVGIHATTVPLEEDQAVCLHTHSYLIIVVLRDEQKLFSAFVRSELLSQLQQQNCTKPK